MQSPLSSMAQSVVVAWVAHRQPLNRALLAAYLLFVLRAVRQGVTSRTRSASVSAAMYSGGKRDSRVAVDAVFGRRLKTLLRIAVPSWRCKEAGLLAGLSCFLVFRTVLSVYVATLDGRIVSALVRAQPRAFLSGIARWMLVAVPATYTNSMLGFLQARLALALRSRLTDHLHARYLASLTFYKVSNLDDRIRNPDQLLTEDVAKLATALAGVYANLAKPALDILIYNYQLAQSVGMEGLTVLTVLVQASANLLRVFTPPFGQLIATEQALEGDFRFVHSRLIENAEEIALYNGELTEKSLLNSKYSKLIKHVNLTFKARIWHGMLEDFIVKYLWGALGLGLCAIPVFVNLPALQMTPAINTDMGMLSIFFVHWCSAGR